MIRSELIHHQLVLLNDTPFVVDLSHSPEVRLIDHESWSVDPETNETLVENSIIVDAATVAILVPVMEDEA